jgi:hypothetical protein
MIIDRAPRHCVRGLAVLALAAFALAGSGLAWSSIGGIRLSRAKTRVGLASVFLETSDLEVSGAELTGVYSIHVPLAPWKDDRGRIRLDMAAQVLAGRSGMLRGSATSERDGRVHSVECTLEPDGDVGIVVTNDERTLVFAARYEGLPASSPARR